MPQMDGWELFAAIRGHGEVRDTPVAILSGHLQPGDSRVAESHACVALLTPCSNDQVVATVVQLAARGQHRHRQSPAGCMTQQPSLV
jgi:CheY-like chemotaxis protein